MSMSDKKERPIITIKEGGPYSTKPTAEEEGGGRAQFRGRGRRGFIDAGNIKHSSLIPSS